MDKVIASKHDQYPSIYLKIRRRFIGFGIGFFIIFWSVVYFSESHLEVISLHHWLDTEANNYIQRYQKIGEKARLPNETEFLSYWSETPIPNWLHRYNKPGFYEHLLGTEDKHFIVFNHPSQKGLMYIVFQDDADDYLDIYEDNLHLFTFICGLLFVFGMGGYGYYAVKSLSKPLNKIQTDIANMSPSSTKLTVSTPFRETRKIEQALLDSQNEIDLFFQREQEFSRFSSHELRTPMMIIRGSTDILAKLQNQPKVAMRAIHRIQTASDEMKSLTETFLLLGKTQIEPHHFETVSLADLLKTELNKLSPLFSHQNTAYQLTLNHTQDLYAPKSFVSIIMNNLIKNAFSYSVEAIQITLTDTKLSIINRHDGHEIYHRGYGCGLVIVERICERQAWQFYTTNDAKYFYANVDFSPQKLN